MRLEVIASTAPKFSPVSASDGVSVCVRAHTTPVRWNTRTSLLPGRPIAATSPRTATAPPKSLPLPVSFCCCDQVVPLLTKT
jgi:hypothetical protein